MFDALKAGLAELKLIMTQWDQTNWILNNKEVQQDNAENKIPQQWVVKFMQNNYGKEVHEYCYQKNWHQDYFLFY
ncbi:8715_t:CDS:2 [Entrophospora sp. SA101]|nr:8715_t:CDS:2 [Entrophospora sp. SA101]